jgi:hypothetical protein
MLSAATAALFSCPSLADTDITTQLTKPINTATDGDITIESDGSVVITTAPPVGAAVMLNSTAGAVVSNGGTISYNGVGSATAVELETGYSGEIVSSGNIEVIGTGSSKTAILISGIPADPNSGTFTGVISSAGPDPVAINLESGSVTQVQGDDSIGISQLSGTTLMGNIFVGGTLSVLPTSGTSTKTSIGNVIAINLAGTVVGNVDIESGGVVTGSGNGAEGLQTLGTVTGSIINDGTLQTYGTANATTQNPSDTNRPQASSALGIGGSVLNGIYNGGPSTVSDTTTLRATLSTAGNEPTIIINPALSNPSPSANLMVGIYYDTADPGNSFLNRGTITGFSENPDVDVTTFSIIGANDTTAKTIFEGNLFNGGTITSSATTDTRASSVTANTLYIGNYAFIPQLTNSDESGSGTISASVSGPESGTATAIMITQYGSLGAINNTGTISSSVVTTNPDLVTSLASYAILDESGTLSSITNSGTISATATTLKNNAQIAVAVDLSMSSPALCNCTGVYFNNSGTVTGAIEFGTGNDTLIDTGTAQIGATINGNVSFGGTTGGVDKLTIGDFGTLDGAVIEQLGSHVDVSIAQGGTLNLENTPTNLGSNVVGLYAGSFDVDPGANLGLVVSQPFNLTINPQTGALIQSQTASIGNDTNFRISFGSYIGNYLPGKGNQGQDLTASFDLLSAPRGDLAISGSELGLINTDFATSLPFLFTGDLCTWNVNGRSTCGGANPGNSELVLNLTPKSAQTLGLKSYALQMFPYVNESLASDDTLGAAMLNDIGNAQEAQSAYAAYAPDVSGATRALAISLTDGATDVVAARQRTLREYADQDGDLTMWTQEFVERLNQDNATVANGYTDSGFGFVLGADEGDPQDGRYGGAFTFFSGGMDAKAPLLQRTDSEWYMATGYTDWHGKIFFLDTQATVGYAHLDGSRSLDLTGGFSREATDSRPAEYLAGGATAGLQYNVAGAAVMPQLSLDGLAMRQEGYTETGNEAGQVGSNGFDLRVEPDYAASVRGFAGVDTRDDINLGDFLLQPEARAGYRYDFANGQESVTANFVDVTPIDQFKISGPKPAAGNALAGGGFAVSTGAWSVGLNFDYLYANSGNTSEEGTLTLLGRI